MDRHAFVHSGKRELRGDPPRSWEVCGECGNDRRAHPRRTRAEMQAEREPKPMLVPSRIQTPELPPARVATEPEPWQLGMLRDAVAHVLELPADAIGWRLRLRVLDVEKAFDVGRLDPPLQRDPVLEEPEPVAVIPKPHALTRPSQRHASRKMLRGMTGQYRDLAERAIDAGWTARKAGNGHVLLEQPTTGIRLTLSGSRAEGAGRGYLNLRAAAKRAGLDVTGL